MAKRVVLHLMNGFMNASIGQIVKNLVENLGDENYQWFIGGLSYDGEMHGEFKRLGATLADFSNSGYGHGNAIQRVRRYLYENGIQIVHTHTMRTLLVAWMATTFHPATSHARICHIVTKHTLTAPGDRKWGAFYSLIDHLTLYLPDYIVPVSRVMEKKILTYPGIKPKRIIFIPNAIPCTEWYTPEKREDYRQKLHFSTDTLAIGFGGRFEQVKRLDLLIDAFANLYKIYPDTRLVLAGEGSLRPKLEKQANELGISHAICWTGFCRDMPALLSALDIYVQCSANEGLPLSILEAMAAGKPVVATQVGGVAEVVTNRENGVLVPPQSAPLLFQAMLDLLENPDKRQKIAKHARQTVQIRYGLESMSAGYQELYERLAR